MWKFWPESGSAERPVVLDDRRLLDDAFGQRRRRLAAALERKSRVQMPQQKNSEDDVSSDRIVTQIYKAQLEYLNFEGSSKNTRPYIKPHFRHKVTFIRKVYPSCSC